MANQNSIARELRLGYVCIGLAAFLGLFLFVFFNVDRYFDIHYKELGLSGLAYEIGDHVILPAVVLVLPIFIATPWVVRRALKPLSIAARRIDQASGSERGFTVPIDDLPAESVPFVSAVNDLLRRLDDAAERQEAFAADIAHELKTPLAILGLELEKYGDPLASKIRADMADMNRLVDQLLLMAQLDADAASRAGYETVALAKVAEEVVTQLAPLAISNGRRIELEVGGAPAIRGRKAAIAAALRNLVENALRVTPEGGAVTVVVSAAPAISVCDGGPGLTSEQLQGLCRRLSRADSASPGGAGLGLSIVSKVMASHNGSLEANPELRELTMVFRDEALGRGFDSIAVELKVRGSTPPFTGRI